MANTLATRLQNRTIQTAILFEKGTNRLIFGEFKILEKDLQSLPTKKITKTRAKMLYYLSRNEVMALPMAGYSPRRRRDVGGVNPVTRLYYERDVEAAALKKFGGVKRFVNFLITKRREWRPLSGKQFSKYPKSYQELFLEALRKDQMRDAVLKSKRQRTRAEAASVCLEDSDVGEPSSRLLRE
ncbi:hypothetical protein CPB83DRAFT_495890 [Crepidotus variabilis]|uniref:Uncharacterized protein n=1 Tax=Crepidotus variabilis TaxID=179855 RepID=A0A9P6EC22_9AGAR|nr:hypothetical protein CPB83DRAFT_495890 [Crepidotus variabilis]